MARSRSAALVAGCLALSMVGFACGADRTARERTRPATASTPAAGSAAKPTNIVSNEDIERTRPGTPERAILTWAQAVQFGDVASVRQAYSSAVRARLSARRLAGAAREIGDLLGKPEIVRAAPRGRVALVRVALISYGPGGQRSVQPTTLRLRREGPSWRLDDAGLLLDTAAALRRSRP